MNWLLVCELNPLHSYLHIQLCCNLYQQFINLSSCWRLGTPNSYSGGLLVRDFIVGAVERIFFKLNVLLAFMKWERKFM